MTQREVAILIRRTVQKRSFVDRFANWAYNRTDFVTEGILAAEVRKTGRIPVVLELTDLDKLSRAKGAVAFVTVNEPQSLYSLIRARQILERNFRSVVIGGQIPGIAPDLVRRIYPKASIFRGEIEGSTEAVLENAESGIIKNYTSFPVDIYKSYTVPERRTDRAPLLQMVELGRGCQYACDFCGMPVNQRRVRTRNPEEAIEEISRLGRKILFVDPNISAYPAEYLEKIFLFMERTGRRWLGEGTAKELIEKPEIWDLMSRTCTSFLTGVESFTREDMLRKNGGSILPQKNGTVIVNSLIVGTADQTEEDVRATVKKFRGLNLNTMFHITAPYPGTKAFRQARDNGNITQDNFLLYDRRHVVIANKMGPEKTVEMYREARMKAHTFSGTIKEIFRVISETKGLKLLIERLISLMVIRIRPMLHARKIAKSEAEQEGKEEFVPIE